MVKTAFASFGANAWPIPDKASAPACFPTFPDERTRDPLVVRLSGHDEGDASVVGSDEAAPSGLQPDGLGPNTISPAQSRAARALLNWSEADLAGKLGFGEDFVRDFESGGREAPSGQLEALRSTLMSHGVVFDGADGVRLSGQGQDEGTRLGALTTENDR